MVVVYYVCIYVDEPRVISYTISLFLKAFFFFFSASTVSSAAWSTFIRADNSSTSACKHTWARSISQGGAGSQKSYSRVGGRIFSSGREGGVLQNNGGGREGELFEKSSK